MTRVIEITAASSQNHPGNHLLNQWIPVILAAGVSLVCGGAAKIALFFGSGNLKSITTSSSTL